MVVSVGCLLVSWTLIARRLWNIGDLSAQVPLHYNIYFGVDAVGAAWQMFLLPGFATLVLGVNIGVMLWQSREAVEKPLQPILSMSAVLVALFALLGTIFALAIPS